MTDSSATFPGRGFSRRYAWILTTTSRIAVAVALSFSFVCPVVAGDWPQWLGPSRNGVSSEVVHPWSHSPKVLWHLPIGSGFSTPVVAEGKFFVHAQVPDKEAEEVIALDAKTGKILWREAYDRPVYKSALGAGPRATPMCVSGRLFTYGITGTLTCFDAAGGKKLWQARPFADFKATIPNFGVCSSPLAVAGKIIIPVGGPGSSVVAYDAASGRVAWKGLDEPACSASPILLSNSAADLKHPDVVVQTTLRIVGLDPDDGSVRWEHPLVFQPSGVSPTPLVVDRSLVCTTQDTGTLSLQFAEGKQPSGPTTQWWRRDWSSYFSTGAVGHQGRVFVVTNAVMKRPRADVRCIDVPSGKELWQKQSLGYFHVGLIATGDEKLLLLDDGGALTLAETAGGFKQLARAKISGGTFCNPVLADGKFYVRDAKEIQCFQLAP